MANLLNYDRRQVAVETKIEKKGLNYYTLKQNNKLFKLKTKQPIRRDRKKKELIYNNKELIQSRWEN